MKTKNNPFISWQEWESHIHEFFRFVLLELAKQPDLPHLEAHKSKDNLNRRLALVCRKNVGKWCILNECAPFTPYFNGRNQAREKDILPHESENKEPDCQVFSFHDSVNFTQYNYTVECKRLHLADDGTPYGSCKYYVEDGILRFMKREYSYGIDVESGLMIAYFQSGDFDKLHGHVNRYCTLNSSTELILNGEWQLKGVSELGQDITRIEMEPEKYKLHHFWLDLR